MPTPSLETLGAALGAAYTQASATPPPEGLIDALARAALAAFHPDPRENPQNITLAILCQRESLPVPPADQVGDPANLVLRGYRRPTGASPYWVLTNTGGRRYRLLAGVQRPLERYRGTSWEEVPEHQEPAVALKLREALALAGAPEQAEQLALI
jgi:hypothetical protein